MKPRVLGTDEERTPRFTDFHCSTGNGLSLRVNRVKQDALIGHGGAQVGDETPLGFSLGSAMPFYLQDLKQ